LSGKCDTSIDQAVVLGASMAGLLAARVLSERFKRVVVIERDALPPVGDHRRGVPHGRHLHAAPFPRPHRTKSCNSTRE
jgi:flavin-dependent dehydrogenase